MFGLATATFAAAVSAPAFARSGAVLAQFIGQPAFSIVSLNPDANAWSTPMGEAIQNGDQVVLIQDVATKDELDTLVNAGTAACERLGPHPSGRNRFWVPKVFDRDTVELCEEMLLRVLDVVDEEMPDVYDKLFRPAGTEWCERQPRNAQGQQPSVAPPEYLEDSCPTLRDLYMAGELEWSEGEPAINVYTAAGAFGCHKDHLALTILIPLTSSDEFEGGGTGFWAGGRAEDENPFVDPAAVLKPDLGTALVFGGDVTHAGMPVDAGLRAVLVASFSTRTDASAEDRCFGLQFSDSSELSDVFGS